MKILAAFALSCLLGFTCLIGQASAQVPNHVEVWSGTIKLWQAEICKVPGCFSIPKSFGPLWKAQLKVSDDSSPGYHAVARDVFTDGDWSVTILIARMNPTDGKVPYVVTQTTLKDAHLGIIASCSRFDSVGAFTFIPPGSCSGQMLYGGKVKLIGVSLYAP